jgi:NAD+ synthase (glutamine-hydrolysing)
MTYDELTEFGRLRKVNKLGPLSMFQRLVHDWKDKCTPRQTAEKVKRYVSAVANLLWSSLTFSRFEYGHNLPP